MNETTIINVKNPSDDNQEITISNSSIITSTQEIKQIPIQIKINSNSIREPTFESKDVEEKTIIFEKFSSENPNPSRTTITKTISEIVEKRTELKIDSKCDTLPNLETQPCPWPPGGGVEKFDLKLRRIKNKNLLLFPLINTDDVINLIEILNKMSSEFSAKISFSNQPHVNLTVDAVNPETDGQKPTSYGGSAEYPPGRERRPPDKEGGSYFKSQYGVEVGKIQGMKNHWFLDTAQRSPGATLSLFADLGQINSHNYAFQTQIKINFVSSINEIIDDDSLKFDLSEVKNSKLMEIIQKFKSLIAKNNFDLGSSAILKHTIDVQGNPRISSRPNRPPFKQKGERNRHIDFLGPIRPISRQSYSYLMVVHDYLIKWIKAIPKPNLLAYTTANALIDHVIPVHGTPKAILADKDRYFTLNSLNNICLCFGINRTIACCPESFDRTLMMVLKPYVGHVHDDWEVLQLVCFSQLSLEKISISSWMPHHRYCGPLIGR